MMSGRPVAALANFIAVSTASPPELAKSTLSRCGTRLSKRSAKMPGQSRCVHLHEVRKITFQDIDEGRSHSRMVAPNGEDAKSAQEIEIPRSVAVIE
jgi:hypothetical protein